RYPRVGDARALRAADRMQQHHTIIGEQVGALGEEGVVKADPDMFEHADGDDAIEGTGRLAIIGELELDPLSEAFFGGTTTRERKLLVGQSHAAHARPAHLGKIKRKSAPAGPDVEHA